MNAASDARDEVTRNGSRALAQGRQHLALDDQKNIAECIWGLDLSRRAARFAAFLDHCRHQIAEDGWRAGASLENHTNDDLLRIAEILKQQPNLPRAWLRPALTRIGDEDLSLSLAPSGQRERSYGTLTSSQAVSSSRRQCDHELATAVKILFAINLSIGPGRILVGQSSLDWRETQSLEEFLRETFPIYGFSEEPHTPIKPKNLRARYLEAHADVRIEWTRHLPDHLTLDVGRRAKVLRIFDLASFLEMTYEALKEEPWELSLCDSLKRQVDEGDYH
ncbi:hypothetical protein ACJZ2D_009011 [Fusarium nematophilum]